MHSGGPTIAFRGANRCIQGGQPLHSGGPTVASTRDSTNKTWGATFLRPRPRQRRGGRRPPSDDPDLDRGGGVRGRGPGRQARLDRRAGGGGQSDTQSDNVGGANRCIQGGQPLHPGGPTVASRGANRCIQGGQPLHQHAIRPIKPGVRPSDDPDLDRGGGVRDGRPSGKPARPPDLKTTPFPALNPSFPARRILHTPVVLRRGEDGATEA